MPHRLRSTLLFALGALIAPATALAGGAEDEARRLFQEGDAAERAGKPAEACAKYRQSLALVREVGPLSRVKDCDLREGKLISGEANLRELIQRWPQPGPELDALNAELKSVEKRVPHLTVTLRAGAPLGVTARLDGNTIDFPANDRAVDPGKHELLVDVPGRPVEKMLVELRDGERKTIEVPAATEAPAKPPPVQASEGGLGALGIVGVVVGAVGVGGFVGAAVTGKLTLDKQDEFEAGHCGPEDPLPAASGCAAIASDGDTLLIANGVLWGIGIAGVAVGATLLIVDLAVSDEPAAPAATVGLGLGTAELTVSF